MSMRTRMRSSHLARQAAAVAGAAALAVLGLAAPAAAHVTANPESAEQGSFTKVSFRVPNERDNADTTKLQIDLPADHPVAFVSVRPVPGWKVKVVTSKLAKPVKSDEGDITEAVTRITWSGGKIGADQFQEFDVSMGPLPDNTDRLVLPAVQTYSNGEVVKWNEEQAAGQEEPEHPAPMLRLTPKGSGEGGHGDAAAAKPAAQAESTNQAAESTADDGTARLLGWLGLATGVIGIGVAGLALAHARRRTS
jgi:uncharacterized protein YcnI